MKRLLIILLSLFLAATASAQVFNTGQTLRSGKITLGVTPVVFDAGGTNNLGVNFYAGYGLGSGLDLEAQLGVANGDTYIGGNVEFAIRGQKPYISVSAGGHIQNNAAFDGTLNLTFPIKRKFSFFGGLDVDVVFGNTTTAPMWLFGGIELGISNKMQLIFELDAGVANNAGNRLAGGLLFYF